MALNHLVATRGWTFNSFPAMSQPLRRLICLLIIIVPCFHAHIEPLMLRGNHRPVREVKDDLYVFPSMQMSRVSADGPPVVEVTYHGKPPLDAGVEEKAGPILPTPVPSRGKLKPPRRRRIKGTPKVKTTPLPGLRDSTWNPDNYDQTANPNKSRKTIKPTPPMGRKPEGSMLGDSSAEESLNQVQAQPTRRLPRMEPKFKEILGSSHDYKAWQDLKSKFQETTSIGNGEGVSIHDILATQPSKKEYSNDLTPDQKSFPNFPPRTRINQSIKVTPLPDYDHPTTTPSAPRPKKEIQKTNQDPSEVPPHIVSTPYRGLTIRPRKPKSHGTYPVESIGLQFVGPSGKPREVPVSTIPQSPHPMHSAQAEPSPFSALPEGFGIPQEPSDPSSFKDPFAGLGPGPRPTPRPESAPRPERQEPAPRPTPRPQEPQESPYAEVFADLGVPKEPPSSPYSSPYAGSGLSNPEEVYHPPEKSPLPPVIPTHRPQPIINTPTPTRFPPGPPSPSELPTQDLTKPPIKKKPTKKFLNYPSKANMIPPATTPNPPPLSIVTPQSITTISSLHNEHHPPAQEHILPQGNSSPRLPRDHSQTHVHQTPQAISIHHSSATAHPAKNGLPGAKSFQSITIVHPKKKLDLDTQDRIPSYGGEKHNHFLPPQITLHTTASPAQKNLPPHMQQDDTVVLSLPNLKPTDIPEGYELIPLDQLTPEYEVVPWNEAQKILNVTISSLGEPKHTKDGHQSPPAPPPPSPSPFAHSTFAPPYPGAEPAPNGEPQSGYQDNRVESHPSPKPKRHYSSEPMSGYAESPYQSPGVPSHGGERDTWYQPPPPISPDLPLSYEDKVPTRIPGYGLYGESDRHQGLVVKGLDDHDYSSPYSNVIHFGTDFAHKGQQPPYSPGHPLYKSLLVHHTVQTTKSPHQVKTIVPHITTSNSPGGYFPNSSPYANPYGPGPTKTSSAFFSTPRPADYGHTTIQPDSYYHSTPKLSYEHPSGRPHKTPSGYGYQGDPFENVLEPDHEKPSYYNLEPEYPEDPKTNHKPHYHSTSQPGNGADEKPHYHSTPKPSYESPKPHSHSTPKPAYDKPKSNYETPESAYGSPKPHMPHLKPAYDEAKEEPYSHPSPSYHNPKPSYEEEKPHYQSTPKPAYDGPKAHYHSTPKPTYEASPKPQYHSTPKPSYEASPKPHYHSTPKPTYEASPKPHYHSTPKPSYEASPKPHYHSTPKPFYEASPQPPASPELSYDEETPHYYSTPNPSYGSPNNHYGSPTPTYEEHRAPESPELYNYSEEEKYDYEYPPGTSIKPLGVAKPLHTTPKPYFDPYNSHGDTPHFHANLKPKDEEEPHSTDYHDSNANPEEFKSSEPDPYFTTTPRPMMYKHPKSLISAFKYMPLTSPFNEIYKPIFSHSTTPRPPSPTTSIYPYRHWSSPQPYHASPSPSSSPELYIHHSTPKDTAHNNHVKSLTPTPQPGYGSSHYSTPKPAYHSTMGPNYGYSTPEPQHSLYPHTTTGPPRGGYHSPSPGYGYSPSPSVGYHHFTTPAPIRIAYSASPSPTRSPSYVKNLDLSHVKLYTPTTPKPRYGSSTPYGSYSPTPSSMYSPTPPSIYSPTTRSSNMVKSLPNLHGSHPGSYPYHFSSQQEQFYVSKHSYNHNPYSLQDIPIHVNHFPQVSPTASALKLDFYTSPQPVYLPGPVQNLSPQPQYSPHEQQVSRQQSEVRLHQLHKYLSSIDNRDPEANLDTDILSQLLSTLTGDGNEQKIRISIPTRAPQDDEVNFDIASLKREPERSSGFKFSSAQNKLFKRKISVEDLTNSSDALEFEPEDLSGSFENGEILVQGPDGNLESREPDLNAHESRTSDSGEVGGDNDGWITRPVLEQDPIPFLEVDKDTTTTTQSTSPSTTTTVQSSTLTDIAVKGGAFLEHEESALFELFEKFLKDKITTTSVQKTRPTRPSAVYIPETPTTQKPIFQESEESEEYPQREMTTMRISTYDKVSGNNIIIGNNTEQTLKQLTKTLRSLTATVRGLNNTIMEATEKVTPRLEQPIELIKFMQGQITKLTQTVSELQSKRETDISQDKVKEVLMHVVKEVQRVDKLRHNLSEQGLTTPSPPQPPHAPSDVLRPKRKQSSPYNLDDFTTHSDIFIASDGVKTHLASNVEWQTVPSNVAEIHRLNLNSRESDESTDGDIGDFKPSISADNGGFSTMARPAQPQPTVPEIFEIPVSASLGESGNIIQAGGNVGASLQVVGDENVSIRLLNDQAGIVVGTSMPVMHPNALEHQSPSRKAHVTTTPKPLRHSFNPSGSPHSASTPRPRFEEGYAHSTPNSLFLESPTPYHKMGLKTLSHWSPSPKPALNQGFAFDNQNRQVRFPLRASEDLTPPAREGGTQPQYGTSYYNSLSRSPTSVRRGDIPTNAVGQSKSGVNIMAELAPHQGERKNLLDKGSPSDSPYIKADQRSPNMEVIMYPSGQLLKSSNPAHPPSSTIGPRLESALLNSYYRNQLPHYVLAKNRRSEFMEKDTELFDPLYESDEVITDTYGHYEYVEDSVPAPSSQLADVGSMITAAAGGIFPKIIRTAKDDLKLMGNVIKLALS